MVLWRPTGLAFDYGTEPFDPLYRGERCLDENDSVRALRDMQRRRDEMRRLLSLGRTLVLFMPPRERWYVDTGRREYSGTGRNRQTTRVVSEVELLSALPFPRKTVEGKSGQLELRAGEPFASFWRVTRNCFEAVAFLAEPVGEPMLVLRGTNSVVGSIAHVDKGLVLLLPQDLLYPSRAVDSIARANVVRAPRHPGSQEPSGLEFELAGASRCKCHDEPEEEGRRGVEGSGNPQQHPGSWRTGVGVCT